MAKLTEAELHTVLATHSDWTLVEGAFIREWKFRDFVEAMHFVNRVATIAEEANHHPDIDIRYDKVRLSLISHDSGGVTERDAAMVNHLDGIV